MRNYIDIAITYYYYVFIEYVVVPQYGPLSHYNKLEGSSITQLEFYFPWYNLWMLLKSPSFVMVTVVHPCVKWP